MKRTHVYLATLLAVSGCGNPTSDATNNSEAKAGEVTMRPGEYEIDFVREVMVPGQSGEPTHEVQSQCFSAEDLKQPESIFVPATDSCRQEDAKASKGDFSAHMVCNLPEYSPSDFVFEVHGTYDSQSADLTGEANLEGATLRETRTFRRQGDC
jgi:hypothetical protein